MRNTTSRVSIRCAVLSVALTTSCTYYVYPTPNSEDSLSDGELMELGDGLGGGICSEGSTHRIGAVLSAGSCARVSQSACGTFSHRGKYAIDLPLTVGTHLWSPISGTIVAIRSHIPDSCHYTAYTGSNGRNGLRSTNQCPREGTDYGNYIVIRPDDPTKPSVVVAHLRYRGVAVALNSRVQAGEFLGYSGHTGFSSSAHVHLGCVQRGQEQGTFPSAECTFDWFDSQGNTQSGLPIVGTNYCGPSQTSPTPTPTPPTTSGVIFLQCQQGAFREGDSVRCFYTTQGIPSTQQLRSVLIYGTPAQESSIAGGLPGGSGTIDILALPRGTAPNCRVCVTNYDGAPTRATACVDISVAAAITQMPPAPSTTPSPATNRDLLVDPGSALQSFCGSAQLITWISDGERLGTPGGSLTIPAAQLSGGHLMIGARGCGSYLDWARYGMGRTARQLGITVRWQGEDLGDRASICRDPWAGGYKLVVPLSPSLQPCP